MAEESNAETTCIPESLLAMAKDARYLETCRELVQQVLTVVSPHLTLDDSAAEASFISSILYTLLVVARQRKTLGMQATGLKFNDSLSRRRIVCLSLIASVATFTIAKIAQQGDRDDVPASESLRGQSRRDYFEAQRRAMLERAKGTISSSSNKKDSVIFKTMGPSSQTQNEWKRKLWRRAKASSQWLSSVISLPLEGPHSIEDQTGTPRSIASWIIRLHMAFFCLNGRYASWFHRLFLGSSYEKDIPNRLVSQPTTSRVVGLMILSQAMGTSVTAISRVFVQWLADKFPPPSSTDRGASIDFGFNPSRSAVPHSEAICGICHQARQHPACPVGCGHVFCWTCLQQWSTTVRPECPLCRTGCTSREIIPLYNYYPSSS